MKIAQEAVKDLKSLTASQVMIVHDLIVTLKHKGTGSVDVQARRSAYRRAQRAFAAYKGDFSADIVAMREDRL